ncbi:MAG: glycerophosphodiester phosphodiesterase [Promethearchaeota archaeon]
MIINFAHRGASGYAPDNTIRSFDLALEMGTKALETDVKVTRDGNLVLFHDYGIGRMPWYRPVLWLTLEGLRRRAARLGFRVPTVVGAFSYYRKRGLLGEILWSIDVPEHLAARKLVAIGRAFGNLSRMLFCSEKPTPVLKWTKLGLPGENFVWSVRDRQIAKLGVEGVVGTCEERGITTLNVKEGWLSRKLASAVKRAGIRLFVWDAHDEPRIDRALSFQPDAIYSNYPDLAGRKIAEYSERANVGESSDRISNRA